jgi:hypothetical protein
MFGFLVSLGREDAKGAGNAPVSYRRMQTARRVGNVGGRGGDGDGFPSALTGRSIYFFVEARIQGAP